MKEMNSSNNGHQRKGRGSSHEINNTKTPKEPDKSGLFVCKHTTLNEVKEPLMAHSPLINHKLCLESGAISQMSQANHDLCG